MSWGQPATAEPVAASRPNCEAPECGNLASLIIVLGNGDNERRNSCTACAGTGVKDFGAHVVGVVEGAPFDEPTRDVLLAEWEAAKVTLERAKASEMEVRKAVFSYCFPNPTVGTQRIPLSGGFNLKAVHSETTKIVAPNEKIDEAEDKAAAIGNEGTFLFERIITWKPEFSKSEYKKLDTSLTVHAQVKKLVDELIETKSGAPALEIEAPKATLAG
jgi:hypothetical protein